jgi:hypothetical protein
MSSTFNDIVTQMISQDGENGVMGSDAVTSSPDLDKVQRQTPELLTEDGAAELRTYLSEARDFLLYYSWCRGIHEEYVGIFVGGVIGVFLFKIDPARPDVDEWIWVIVGDVPPTYLTCDRCPNPATALDGYIGAMTEWVEAASNGESVAELIPVDVPATLANAELLRKRLSFLDTRILSQYRKDLARA